MIQKIRFSFVFSKQVLIPFDMISHKVGKYYYLTTSRDVGIDSIYRTKHLLKTFCFSRIGLHLCIRPKRLDVWAIKNTLLKKPLTKIIKILGGSFEQQFIYVHGKRVIKRIKYLITKIESGSC